MPVVQPICGLLGKKQNKTKGQTKKNPTRTKQSHPFASQAVITAVFENLHATANFQKYCGGTQGDTHFSCL